LTLLEIKMRITFAGARTLSVALLAAGLLAGCSGAGQQTPSIPNNAMGQQSFARQFPVSRPELAGVRNYPQAALQLGGGDSEDAKSAALVYVSQFQGSSVNAYTVPDPKNSKPKCQVNSVSAVLGIGVNAAHDLYVPNAGTRTLNVYGPKCGKLLESVAIPGSIQDSDVAFNEKTKTAYVDLTTPAEVLPIKFGAKSFGTALACAPIANSYDVGVDAKGNVYQGGITSSGAPILAVWKGAKGSCQTLNVTGLGFPVGLAFDAKSNLIVTDIGTGVLIYKPPYSGAPTRTITPKGEAPYSALDAKGVNLYVANLTAGSVDVYKYGSGTYEYSITNGITQTNQPWGVAIDPP